MDFMLDCQEKYSTSVKWNIFDRHEDSFRGKRKKEVFKHLLKKKNADQRFEPTLHRSHNSQQLELSTAPRGLVL